MPEGFIRGEHTEEGEKTNGEETQDKQAQAGQKEKEGRAKLPSPKQWEEQRHKHPGKKYCRVEPRGLKNSN